MKDQSWYKEKSERLGSLLKRMRSVRFRRRQRELKSKGGGAYESEMSFKRRYE